MTPTNVLWRQVANRRIVADLYRPLWEQERIDVEQEIHNLQEQEPQQDSNR